MGNSILSNRQPNVPQGQNNAFNPQMIQQFNQFRKTFNGNPQQAVMNLMNMLRQGMMTNAQFQQLAQMANQFQNFMK